VGSRQAPANRDAGDSRDVVEKPYRHRTRCRDQIRDGKIAYHKVHWGWSGVRTLLENLEKSM
jgi:hypothetical protein